jgi:hypothetical protein
MRAVSGGRLGGRAENLYIKPIVESLVVPAANRWALRGTRGFPLELAGLEPATSWVRLGLGLVRAIGFGLVERNQVTPVLPDFLNLVARVVAPHISSISCAW